MKINQISYIFNSGSEWEITKALVALQRILTKKTVLDLRRLAKSNSNRLIKYYAVLEIWHRKHDRAPKNLLKNNQKCSDINKIGEAIKQLCERKYKGATDLFINLLKNKNSYIRTCAALSLVNNPSQKAFRPLLQAIKNHKENCAVFVHALEALDCQSATEILVDLFISKSDAPLVRINIIECFETGAIKKISCKVGKRIKAKIFKAIQKSRDVNDKYELHRFYEESIEPKIQ